MHRPLPSAAQGQASLLRKIDAARSSTLLFLFNFQRRTLLGCFFASGPAGFPLEPSAWAPRGGRTAFPSQIPVAWHGARLPALPEADFAHVVRYTQGHNFELSLSAAQVKELVGLFLAQPTDLEADEADEADCEAATVRKPHPADFGPRKWRKGSY